MRKQLIPLFFFVIALPAFIRAGEKAVVSLKDFSTSELKMAGIELPLTTTLRIKALGGGGDYGWTHKSDEMFAYCWIIDADTRNLVWKLDTENSTRSGPDREFDGRITLPRGIYEVYFAATTFSYHTTFSHTNVNIDHRNKPPFHGHGRDKNFFSIFRDWWSDDIAKEWEKRSKNWGIELFVDDATVSAVRQFTPPKEFSNVLLKVVGVEDNTVVRQGFSVSEPSTVHIYALGEGPEDKRIVDFGWIVNTADRSRVWEMAHGSTSSAGGAEKNMRSSIDVTFPKGNYVLYYVTDDSHSPTDWNDAPPYDPLNYGITLMTRNDDEKKNFKTFPYAEDENIIVKIARVTDDQSLREGFTLKEDAKVRVYAFGERSNYRRELADYAYIIDAKTREKIWTMDVDRVLHAGGALKNFYADEVITLPKGSYIVSCNTDDSHAYGDWNADPPFDPEHYGITLMGVGPSFSKAIVARYVPEQDNTIVAQIVKVRDDADLTERFKLDRTTRVRIYAIGEGEKRHMYDYGWIEDAATENIVWEMTYSMTFHGGGGRKNRMVNTTLLLEKGEYLLRYRSDDSHSFGDWNVSPPEDQEYWGIILYRDDIGSARATEESKRATEEMQRATKEMEKARREIEKTKREMERIKREAEKAKRPPAVPTPPEPPPEPD